MKITIICTFLLMVFSFSVTFARPETYSIDKIDRDVSGLEYDYRNSRLRRSYYDDGYYGYYSSYPSYSSYPVYSSYPTRSSYPVYTSVRQPIRRQDVDDDKNIKYEPLVRYSSRQTKRQKLFVPNLWG